jgi:NAD(P)-dependent dehydrogenase (short-subunit alcohol dehydrogenase family)
MTTQTQNPTTSVFLVSGGARGITAQCVIKLAQHQPGKFILLGRSAIAESEPDFAQDCFEEAVLKKRIMENILSQGEKPTPMSVQKIYNSIISSREIKQTTSTIQKAGSTAEYISVDVTNPIALSEKIAAVVKRTGAITGIIHGAGNLADKLLRRKPNRILKRFIQQKLKD